MGKIDNMYYIRVAFDYAIRHIAGLATRDSVEQDRIFSEMVDFDHQLTSDEYDTMVDLIHISLNMGYYAFSDDVCTVISDTLTDNKNMPFRVAVHRAFCASCEFS